MAKIAKQAAKVTRNVAKSAKSAKASNVKANNVKAKAKANAKANVKASNGKAKAKAEKVSTHQPLQVADNAKVIEVKLDTMRKGSKVYNRFAKIKRGMTVADIIALNDGPSRYDLACAFNRKRIAFK